MQERLDFVVHQRRRSDGFSFAVGVSVVLHVVLMIAFLRGYRPAVTAEQDVPIARYVQLIARNPQEFVEAPGPAVESARLNAPYSDANRRASIPKPTGEKPTARPGDGLGAYTPPMTAGSSSPERQPAAEAAAAPQSAGSLDPDRIPALRTEASMAPVNWRSAIREVGQVASLAGTGGLDLSDVGGEKGYAEAGPLSFETQWYEWGEYAQSMISRIRVNWYDNMPMLIRTGMQGVVTIRFTIQRDGRITDITTLESSTIPPYDFAARKAIELSSPLNPLPKDFPKSSERVTAMFYYNSRPPAR